MVLKACISQRAVEVLGHFKGPRLFRLSDGFLIYPASLPSYLLFPSGDLKCQR
jgi:hypothetical protein